MLVSRALCLKVVLTLGFLHGCSERVDEAQGCGEARLPHSLPHGTGRITADTEVRIILVRPPNWSEAASMISHFPTFGFFLHLFGVGINLLTS